MIFLLEIDGHKVLFSGEESDINIMEQEYMVRKAAEQVPLHRLDFNWAVVTEEDVCPQLRGNV